MSHIDIGGALSGLGVQSGTLSEAERGALDRIGYAVFEDVLEPSIVDELRSRLAVLEAEEGARRSAGNDVATDPGAVRVDDLNHKGSVFDVVWTHPKLMAAVAHLLGDFRLSSITARAARPGAGHQSLHVDWWGPIEEQTVACNSCWALTDFNKSNGTTRVVPGSHRWRTPPSSAMDDPRAAHPEEVYIEAPAGSLVVFHGYLWHSGTDNTSSALRRGIFCAFSRRGWPRQNDQAARLDEVTAARLSRAARYILDA